MILNEKNEHKLIMKFQKEKHLSHNQSVANSIKNTINEKKKLMNSMKITRNPKCINKINSSFIEAQEKIILNKRKKENIYEQ